MSGYLILLIPILGYFIFISIIQILTFGPPIRKCYYNFIISQLKLYVKLSPDVKYRYSMWAPINEKGETYKYWRHAINKSPKSLLFKYYISSSGVVWRWSKLHRAIEKRFEELNNETDSPGPLAQIG